MNLGHETERVEFKKSTSLLKEGVQSIAAILNKHGSGVLYFGVADDGEVIGQQIGKTTLRDISQAVGNDIRPPVYPNIERCVSDDGKEYIAVEFVGAEQPYACRNVYRTRTADEDIAMSLDELEAMMAERINRKSPWDGRPSGRPVSDADERQVRRYVAKGIEKNRIPPSYADFDDCGDVLERLGLAKEGVLTNAADQLFCESNMGFRLSMGVLAGNNRVNIVDLRQETGPVFGLIDEATYYVTANIRRRIVIDGSPMREEIPEIPREAIREAIINAFCHMKYEGEAAGRVMIDVFTDTVEITNAGLFPLGTTPDDYLSGKEKRPGRRNPNLADAMFRGGLIEAFGSGLKRIKDACDAEGVKFEYHQDLDETRIVFHRPGSQVEYVGQEESVSAAEREKRTQEVNARIGRENRTRESDARIGRENRTRESGKVAASKKAIVDCVASSASPIGRSEIAGLVGLSPSRTSDYLRELVSEGALVVSGGSRWRVYSLGEGAQRSVEESKEGDA